MKKSVLLFLFFSINIIAQVGIGGMPDASSQLDVNASDKGILIPRVNLNDVSNTSLDGVNNAVEGLLIYNTNSSVVGGDGKGFYHFNGTKWEKLTGNRKNISVIPIDTGQIYFNSTAGQDVQGYDTALEPMFYNDNGNLEIKLIIRYSSIQGTVHFQLHAYDNSTEKWPIVYTDFGIYAGTHNGGVATSDWKKWNAGTNAHEIHLFAWVENNGNSSDHVTIESAYLLVRSQ
jgi:hypothetical protein